MEEERILIGLIDWRGMEDGQAFEQHTRPLVHDDVKSQFKPFSRKWMKKSFGEKIYKYYNFTIFMEYTVYFKTCWLVYGYEELSMLRKK